MSESSHQNVHPQRAAVLAELHARPFAPLESPTRVLHFGYACEALEAKVGRATLVTWLIARGAEPPDAEARHWRTAIDGVTLSWEQHTEFITHTWTAPDDGPALGPRPQGLKDLAAACPTPGPMLVGVNLHLVRDAAGLDPDELFDSSALAASLVDGGAAWFASDFRIGSRGLVRMVVADRSLTPSQAGALTQRLLEIETYRTFALLGLPEAQRVAPSIHRIESELAGIGREMADNSGLGANHRLLDRLTVLAAELEADAALSSYRFGASRAYDEIVRQRLAVIDEKPLAGRTTIADFLSRRMAPAMRTCVTTGQRQADLSAKLTRAAGLLRTRVDVELQQQNRDLLTAMNRRAQLQLRLQQTVEGLSVVAISYYALALFGYVAKGLKDAGWLPLDVGIATAIATPVVLALVWLAVRRIRRRHTDVEQ